MSGGMRPLPVPRQTTGVTDDWDRHCISCGARIGAQVAICPACGALNTRGLGDEGPFGGVSAGSKRLKILWWTYTVRGTEVSYLQIDSAFGVRTTLSWGRWVLSNVLIIGFLTVLAIVFLALWASTGVGAGLGGALLFALLDVIGLALFLWTMTPPRKRVR